MQRSITKVQRYWEIYASNLDVPHAPWGSKQFFDKIKSEHDKAYTNANRILDLSGLDGRSLLELGCGIGLDTVEFARHGAKVTAIDLSPICIELTKRILAYNNLTATLEVANAEELSYPPSSFDIVVARGILMFTPNDRLVVDQILRVLKPGGEANILLHNRLSWYVLLARLSKSNLVHQLIDPPINRLHSMWEAKRLFAKYSSVTVYTDRFPTKTNRLGLFPGLFNSVFVPMAQCIPRAVMKPFGYYLIIKAFK
jgi:ubiquinone/menaquinone biosynthesis C-methylase UbiE